MPASAPRLTGDPRSEQIRVLSNTLPIVELRERIKLCEEIAGWYSHSPLASDEEFRKQMVSVSPIHELQARVSVIRENRRLRSLSPTELKAESAAARPQPPKYEYPQLPSEYYDGYKIVASSAPQIKDLLRRYGREQVDAAIMRYKKLQSSYNQGDEYTP